MKFDSYHPAINFIFFAAAIGGTIAFKHPIFLGISWTSAFTYSVMLNGKKALIFNLCLIPLILIYSACYSYYNHFGSTELRQNFTGNSVTLEAIVFGIVIGVTCAAVIMWMSCVFAVVSSDKVVYLFGRISPKLSLFISIMLRSVPRIKWTAGRINISRQGIGMGCRQGNIIRKLRNCFRLVSIVMTWTMESFVESARSMKSRGYTLRGRTAFSIYRFDNRDRIFVITIFLCLTLIIMAVLFDQTQIIYDPQIIMNRITPVSYIFYAAYTLLLLFPAILQKVGEIRFAGLRKQLDTAPK